jgi:modification methylase
VAARLASREGAGGSREAPPKKMTLLCERTEIAYIKPDSTLRLADGFEGSIHQSGKHLMNGSPCNGWQHWYFEAKDGQLYPIDVLRERYRQERLDASVVKSK